MPFQELLKNRELSHTRSRVRLMEVLSEAALPLSEMEIEERMKGECNRTTIYRNLSALLNKGMVQRIIAGNAFKYKLLPFNDTKRPAHDHVHFKCTRCNQLVCLQEIMVKDYSLPEGYRKTENQFLILGLCKNCNHD
jgi:Fur family ferric uptake transcriptional regulator